jgi:HrpA-like RNA helicase
MPTLLEPNKIIAQKWHKLSEKKQLEESASIDYLMQWIADRVSVSKGTQPKIKPKGIGSRVLILRSKTGSGKSTVLPTKLFNTFFQQMHRNIVITQPTRVTTQEIPYDIAKWNKNITLGETIGFQTGTVSRKGGKGILFCTIGVLLQFLKTLTDEQFMKKFAFCIIDEVHNRSIETDMTLFYIKQFLLRMWKEPLCPMFILTSGTFEPEIFMNYYECPKEHFIDVVGATHPTIDHFTKFDVTNYITYIVDLVENIHVTHLEDILTNKLHRDILIFVQGAAQIKKISDLLHQLNTKVFSKSIEEVKKHNTLTWQKYGGKKTTTKTNEQYYILPIALMSENISKGSKEYIDLFSPIESVSVQVYEFNSNNERTEKVLYTSPVSRRVMIGTNAIETGITIATLGYCIDSGFVKESQYDPIYGCQILMDKNVTQASSKQRRGRVGRNAPGEFYACYTKDTFDTMPELPFPDIIKENIALFLLNIIIQETQTTLVEVDHQEKDAFQKNKFDQRYYKLEHGEVFDINKLDFIQPPTADSISSAIELLHGLGLITHEYIPTIFGYYTSKFRKLKIENIRMILAGYSTGAYVLDLITIACFLQHSHELGIRKNKYKPRNPLLLNEKQADYYYKYIIQDEFIEYLFIWHDFMQQIDSMQKSPSITNLDDWCKENSLKLDGLLKVVELRDEVLNDTLTLGLNPYYNSLKLDRGNYSLVKILKRNLAEGLDEVIKIKQAIYEGYRFNVCILNDINKKYIAKNHNTVNVTSNIITDHQPQKIIVGQVMLQESFFNKGMYEFTGNDISVLDGYVIVDMTFLQH